MRPAAEDQIAHIERNSGPTANAQIIDAPSKYVWLVTMIAAFLAMLLGLWLLMEIAAMRQDVNDARDAIRDASIAAERADKAERAATLAREYAVSAFYQTQAEWAKRGVELPPILGHHDPTPNEAYEQFDNYVESAE